MTFPLRVRVGGWLAAGDDDVLLNGEGFVIAPDGFTGWDDGVDTRRDMVARPSSPGSFVTPGYADSRLVTLSGSCWAMSEQKLDWFKRQLTGLFPDRALRTVTVEHQGSTLWAMGTRGAKPTFKVTGADPRDALWSLSLWFPDPWKYGETRTFGPGTTVVAHHYGNTDARPKFTVASAAGIGTGYTINGPDGEVFTVTQPVAAGVPHVIENGLLYINGAVVYDKISSGETWTIPPGVSVSQSLVPVSGSGTLSVEVKDTSE